MQPATILESQAKPERYDDLCQARDVDTEKRADRLAKGKKLRNFERFDVFCRRRPMPARLLLTLPRPLISSSWSLMPDLASPAARPVRARTRARFTSRLAHLGELLRAVRMARSVRGSPLPRSPSVVPPRMDTGVGVFPRQADFHRIGFSRGAFADVRGTGLAQLLRPTRSDVRSHGKRGLRNEERAQ